MYVLDADHVVSALMSAVTSMSAARRLKNPSKDSKYVARIFFIEINLKTHT